MYASRTTQLIVGFFTLMGILALGYLSVRLGNVALFPAPSYTVYANFDNIAGLRNNDRVEIAGVNIGRVSAISLQNNRAHVALRINQGVEVDSEAIASVLTSGLIGYKFVSIALGAGDDLKDGGTIRQTQSAFVLENAIGSLINNMGSSSKSPAPGPSAGPSPGSGTGNGGGAK
jgi:phospholipid/cholesterol/gamma-HCH transport system substrate-binding protein